MRLLILSLLVLIVLPSLAFADVITPGEKQIDFCYNITNIDKYPDYVFLIHDTETSGFTDEITPGECFSFYKFGKPWIFAVKKSDYVEEEARGDEFFESEKSIPSGFQLSGRGSTSIFDPLEKVTTLLEIVSLDDKKLEIKKLKEINTYTGGISVDESDKPDENFLLNFSNIWYIVLPVVAIIA